MRDSRLRAVIIALALFATEVRAQTRGPDADVEPTAGRSVAPSGPGPRIDGIVARAALPGARLSILAIDASSGRVLLERGADQLLNPASNAKIVTAAAALSLLGGEHRFDTTLHGEVTRGEVTGALFIKGGGDPSLTSSDLLGLAHELHRAGIRRVQGDVVVDDRSLGAEHLPPAFEQQPNEHAAFRAAVSALSVDENALVLHVRAGATAGAQAAVIAEPRGYIELQGSVATNGDRNPHVRFEVTRLADGREHGVVGGTFPSQGAPAAFRRRLENPSLAAGHALRHALESLGIQVTGGVRVGDAPADATLLARHQSAPLSSLLYEVGKDSNNFYAEMLLLAIAAQDPQGAVTFERGAQRVSEWLRARGVPMTGMQIRNGSGLFDANRYSARQLVGVLRAVWRDPGIRDEYIAQLAVGGVDGTLHNRLRLPNASRRVRAKTGTLDDAIALSGFILSPSTERTIAFSILANGVHGHQADARQLADRIVGELVSWSSD